MNEKPTVYAKHPLVEEVEPGEYFWCACGRSAKQPYCDGSHKGSSFSPMKVQIKEKMKVPWCLCRQTKNPPYCDGAHASVKE